MMPRDMDLIRTLMLNFEHDDTSTPTGYTDEQAAYHVKQLIEEHFLVGEVVMAAARGKKIPVRFFVHDITWKGHDFIKFTRDDTAWRKAKAHLQEKAVPWTIDIILAFLKSESLKALGLK